MIRRLLIFTLLVASSGFSSQAAHKFYVSIYQIEFAADKKRLEITSRVFIDDLSHAIEKKFGRKVHFAAVAESAGDVDLLKKYFALHFLISVNGQKYPMEYLSHEYENDVMITYFRISGLSKVNHLEITNTALTDLEPDQQNIVHTTVAGKKRSVILTARNPKEKLNFLK